MEKLFINFTFRFLRMNRLLLFLLIAFPITLKFYSPQFGDFSVFNRLFASIGGVCLLCWLFAIGHRANKKLVSQGIYLNSFRFFNLTIILVVVSFLLIVGVATNVNTTINDLNVNYYTPLFLPVIFVLAFIFTIFLAAKTLVSAELNKDAGISEYFITVILMLFSAIGLWFIQPRVQSMLDESKKL